MALYQHTKKINIIILIFLYFNDCAQIMLCYQIIMRNALHMHDNNVQYFILLDRQLIHSIDLYNNIII